MPSVRWPVPRVQRGLDDSKQHPLAPERAWPAEEAQGALARLRAGDGATRWGPGPVGSGTEGSSEEPTAAPREPPGAFCQNADS